MGDTSDEAARMESIVVKEPQHPEVAVIGCGGTISSMGTSSLDLMDYPEFGHKLGIEQILERIPEVSSVASVIAVPFRSIGSTNIAPADWFALRAIIRRLSREHPDLAGIVVVH